MTRRLAAAALLLAVACGKGPIASGQVVDRQYVPPRDYAVAVSDYTYLCFPATRAVAGPGGRISYTMALDCGWRYSGSHLEPRHDGPRYRLRLRDDADSGRLGWVDVPPDRYDQYAVGGHYPDQR